MDIWKFYGVTHREHVILNPTSDAKLDELVRLLRLPRGSRAVDIACGKAEFLLRLVESYGVSGVGIDISPYFVSDAKARISKRAPDADLVVHEMDGAAFTSDRPESFELASCIGASWVFHGHAGTLEALMRLAAPGGWVVVGEPFWIREPTSEYLEASGDAATDFGTHLENVRVGERLGLKVAYTIVSSPDDWDRYEGLQWYATEAYARDHPEDPDLTEIVRRVEEKKRVYLKWGRDTLGWAIYVFRRPLG